MHSRRRARVRRRRAVATALLLVLLVVAGYGLAQLWPSGSPAEAGSSAGATGGGTSRSIGPATSSPTATEPKPTGTVTLSAVGDTMLGYAGTLAPDPDTYFDGVRPQITGDIRFANMEGTLTNLTSGKCGANSTACYEFRVPPSWARYFKHAGFTIVSNANNHAFDFWQAGLDDTVTALDREGLAHTGRTHEITYLHVHGLTVAFIGVASYPNTGPLNDYPAARRLIQAADRHADMVVVAMHAGAEGVDAEHLTGQDEIYEGENRGNPEAFAHMAIDAGADLIIGYSPRNFAGYHNFTTEGALGVSGILHVKLAADGRFLSGRLVSTVLAGAGQPELDPAGQAAALVEQLSREDMGGRGAHLSADGVISP